MSPYEHLRSLLVTPSQDWHYPLMPLGGLGGQRGLLIFLSAPLGSGPWEGGLKEGGGAARSPETTGHPAPNPGRGVALTLTT